MSDDIDSLLGTLRTGTQGLNREIAALRSEIDRSLTGGFESAGKALETSLSGALRRGSLGFEDLRRVALSAFADIARQGAQSLFASGGAGGGTSASADLSGLVSGLLGLPGRATGGNVAPGRGYLVGERGPEVFVPTSAGRIETTPAASSAPREVRVSMTLAAPRGSSTPRALERSSRQIASSLRRAIALGA